jgi:hypothetical protein
VDENAPADPVLTGSRPRAVPARFASSTVHTHPEEDTMKRTRTAGFLTVSILLSLLTACASAGGRAEEDRRVWVRVNNTTDPPETLAVYIQPEKAGTQRQIGVSRPASNVMFPFEPAADSLSYRLRAERAGGAPIVSPTFRLVDVDVVEWDVGQNALRVEG